MSAEQVKPYGDSSKSKKEEVVKSFMLLLREAISLGVTEDQVMILVRNTLPNAKKMLPAIEGALKTVADKVAKLKIETILFIKAIFKVLIPDFLI